MNYADDKGEDGSELVIDFEEKSDSVKYSKPVINSSDNGSGSNSDNNSKNLNEVLVDINVKLQGEG